MKILVVDNNLYLKLYPQKHMIKSFLSKKNKVYFKFPDELDISDSNADKIILTGSSAYTRQNTNWMKKEKKFIKGWIKNKKPILGICFGSQLISEVLFGNNSVEALPFPIRGSIQFKKSKSCRLFNGLPNEFNVVSTHYEISKVPVKYSVGKVLDIDGYAFEYKNIFGLQFHPELMGFLGRNFVKIETSLYNRNVYQDFSLKTNKNYGKKIFSNFELI